MTLEVRLTFFSYPLDHLVGFPGPPAGDLGALAARAPALHVLLVHFIVSFEISLGWRIRKVLRRRRSRISIWIW